MNPNWIAFSFRIMLWACGVCVLRMVWARRVGESWVHELPHPLHVRCECNSNFKNITFHLLRWQCTMRTGSDWPWNEIINSIQSHHLLLCGSLTVNNGAHTECSISLNVPFIIGGEEKIVTTYLFNNLCICVLHATICHFCRTLDW